MRILFIEPAGAGGISHCTYALAKALGERGAYCDILTGRRWRDRPLPDSVRVHRAFNGVRTNPLRLLSACRQLRQNVDIVHWQCSTYPRLMLGFMQVAPLQNIPWVYTVHNVLPHEVKMSSVRLYGKTYDRMQGLIFHTQHSLATFRERFPHTTPANAVIPLGEYSFLFPHQETVADDSPRPIVLFFGNIRPYKGLDILIEAMAQVRDRIPDAKLLIAGQTMGSFEPYEERIKRLSLESCVETRFGYIPDAEIPSLLNSASVAALPYREIDQSAALMLMLAYGKATIASRVGGIAETIRHNETGLLVPPNDPHALASSIVQLLLDRDKARRLGEKARQDVRVRFSWETIAERTMEFYRKIESHC